MELYRHTRITGCLIHIPKQTELLSDECLADLRAMIATAGEDAALLAEIRAMFPQVVLERVGLSDRSLLTAN
jgi:hypothetical protein